MITVRRSEDRGHADHGWLDTYHTFSFADYWTPEFVGFGPLRVLNQDKVAASRGFGTHGHRDMEIVTYVLGGVLEHRDSLGNGSRILPGEVQLLSAGTGVTHSEFNASSQEELEFLQMWIVPRETGTEPRYEQRAFDDLDGQLRLVVSPDGAEGSLSIAQDAHLFVGRLAADDRVEHVVGSDRSAWLHVARGELRLNGELLGAGDGAAVQAEPSLVLQSEGRADVVFWELPAVP